MALGLLTLCLTPPAFAQQAEPGPPPPPAANGPTEAAPPAPTTPPGPYYVEPPGGETEPGREPPPARPNAIVLEPPEPGVAPRRIFEPPPPPVPRHVAPETALWLGARLGWFVPFGSIYARTIPIGDNLVEQRGVAWRDYASSGPMFELDVGARLSRSYNLFGLWERAELGGGRGDGGLLGSTASSNGGDTDYWAVGVRASSDPDRVGFLSELSLGYRRARSQWDDGTTLELTQGLFEARLGFGADIRISPKFSLSPMLTFGVGLFGSAELVDSDGASVNLIDPDYDQDGHGWFTLQLGAHFDLSGGA